MSVVSPAPKGKRQSPPAARSRGERRPRCSDYSDEDIAKILGFLYQLERLNAFKWGTRALRFHMVSKPTVSFSDYFVRDTVPEGKSLRHAIISPLPSAEERVIRNNIQEIIMDAINQLTPLRRYIILKMFFEEKNLRDLSREIFEKNDLTTHYGKRQITFPGVRWAKNRALRDLKEILADRRDELFDYYNS